MRLKNKPRRLSDPIDLYALRFSRFGFILQAFRGKSTNDDFIISLAVSREKKTFRVAQYPDEIFLDNLLSTAGTSYSIGSHASCAQLDRNAGPCMGIMHEDLSINGILRCFKRTYDRKPLEQVTVNPSNVLIYTTHRFEFLRNRII